MNARLLLLVLGAACSCLFHCFGGDTNNLDDYLISVRSTNGLTLGVEMREPDGTNSTEVRIGLAFKAPAGAHSIIFIPKDEYLARLSLWDANNTPVAATRLGANYGRHFGDLYYDIKKFASQPHGPRNASDKWEGGGLLPKLSDLFELSKPGTYRLRLEIQILLYSLDLRGPQTRQVVRFQLPDIVVVKPAALQDVK